MGSKRGKIFFHGLGIAIVLFWFVMTGLLVKRVHFSEQSAQYGFDQNINISIESTQRDWKEIYLKERKVGYAVNIIQPFEKGYYIQEEIFLRLNLMGLGKGLYIYTRSRVDDKFMLKNFHFGMKSGAVTFNIEGKVKDDQMIIKTGNGKEQRTLNIKLSRTPMLGAGIGYFFKSRKIEVGETFKFPLFDPATMAMKDTFIRVVSKESLKIYKINYEAFRLETVMFGKRLNFWVDENGTILKEEGFMGLTTIKSSAARAPRDIETEGIDDLYEMTAVAVKKHLPHPSRIKYLKLKIDGMGEEFNKFSSLNSERQSYKNGVLEITQEKPPYRAPYNFPYDGYNAQLKSFLNPEFNVESDDDEIILKARQITGDDDNPARMARRLMRWVYKNVEKRPVITIPTAKEVLKTMVGDCNEHATLLTALLRASGIPARFSIGLVYMRGKFFYHAWTEAYVGRWISMDATMNQMPADATHIKFIEGNLDKQVEIAGLIGTLKIQVLDYGNDRAH